MEFSEKLRTLRESKGMSQEDLADALAVSHQAVRKWESGQAYPETEKLLQLSNLLQVSLDDLLKPGDAPPVRPPQGEEGRTFHAGGLLVDDGMVRGYLEGKRQKAQVIALGVGILVASLCFVLGMAGTAGIMLFLISAGVGIALIVYAGFLPKPYERMEKEPLDIRGSQLEGLCKYQEEQRRRFGQFIVLGVLLLLFSVALLVGSTMLPGFLSRPLRGAVGLCWGGAVAIFVYVGILMQSLSVLTDNASHIREQRTDAASGRIFGVVMPMTVVLYLILGFFFDAWHPGWLVFPIAALTCTAYTTWKSGKRK